MWIVQPSTLALILAAATLSTMVAAETTVTKETHPYKDTEQGKPANPLFACSVESRRCMYADDFTSLPYTGNLQLSTCHHDNALKQLGRWLFNPRHKFINSFWVYCYANDGDCQRYVGDHRGRLDEVAADMDKAVTEQTHCKPTFNCFELNEADDKCFYVKPEKRKHDE